MKENLFKKAHHSFCLLTFAFCLAVPAVAKPRLAPAHLDGEAVEDLPAPYNLQVVVPNRAVSLNWAWDPPVPGPDFQTFGYEVYRDTGLLAIVPAASFTDFAVTVGTHSYKVRAKGNAKEIGKKVAHYSAWSEPADAAMRQTCPGAPVIRLLVEPTRRKYGSIPALRLHFTGEVTVPPGCHLDHVLYHIDSGVSAERTGPMPLHAGGHFDEFIDAIGPEDESLSGAARFDISVTAKDEAGGGSSGVTTIDLSRENPYAPKQPR